MLALADEDLALHLIDSFYLTITIHLLTHILPHQYVSNRDSSSWDMLYKNGCGVLQLDISHTLELDILRMIKAHDSVAPILQ